MVAQPGACKAAGHRNQVNSPASVETEDADIDHRSGDLMPEKDYELS